MRAGLTQEVLAERAGVSVATLGALEQGRRQPHPHTLAVLAEALGLAPADHTALLELASGSSVRADASPPPPALPETARPETARSAARVRLPVPPTALIGRAAEVAEARALLDPTTATTRLLTLVGPGGVGKTRLALAVAAELVDRYPDGVVFVDLAPLRDQRLVPAAIARTLHVQESGGRSARDLLFEHLNPRQLLLVPDNCEHLVDACAELVTELLRACPRLLVLATSRERLAIEGEVAWRVPSLGLPGPDAAALPALRQSAAVQLFVERATAALPSFSLSERNSAAVAEVCRRLDGIPLALELAAARVSLLSPEQLVARLGDRFRLLTAGTRTAPPRQQTLRATVEWSVSLLTDAERRLLRRLAVFAGGCSLEAVEAVCAGDGLEAGELVELLGRLVDKSLVVVEPQDQLMRYRLLETIRQFAWEQLEGAGEAEAVRGRHRDWCLGLAEQGAAALRGPDQAAWLEQLEREHGNVRAALDWLTERGEAESSLPLAAAMAWFWEARGYAAEGRARLAGLLTLPGAARSPARATALLRLGFLAWAQGDYRAHQRHTAEALALARELGDRPGIASAMCELGVAAVHEGRDDEGQALLEESLARYGALDDRWGIALARQRLAGIAWQRGEYAAADRLFAEALALRRALGDRSGAAHVLSNMGWMALYRGDLAAARARQEESLAIRRELGDRREIAVSLTALGRVAFAEGDGPAARALYRESLPLHHALGNQWGLALALEGLVRATAEARPAPAARLAGAAAALRAVIGRRMPPAERAEYEQVLAGLRAALGEPAFAAAWAEGEATPLEQALADALAAAGPEPPPGPAAAETSRR